MLLRFRCLRFTQRARDLQELFEQLLRGFGPDRGEQGRSNGFTRGPERSVRALTRACQGDYSCSRIGGMRMAGDEAAGFQKQKHRADRVGVRTRPACQIALCEGRAMHELSHQYELIGRDAMFCQYGLGPPVHRQVGGPQRHRERVTEIHRPTNFVRIRLIRISLI